MNPRIEKLMQDFASKYVTRRIATRVRATTDDPALAFVLITNENDLTHHFRSSMLPDKGNPFHAQLFATKAKEFARRTGMSARRSVSPGSPVRGRSC